MYFTLSRLDTTSEIKTVEYRLYADSASYLSYLYSLPPGSYMVDLNMSLIGFDKVIDGNVNTLDLFWEMYVPQKEKGRKNEMDYTTVLFKHFQDEVAKLKPNTKKRTSKRGNTYQTYLGSL
ncbi:MAG: hypothetical protein HC896_12120 [Bacteroidales bacterium]|nr:hypothetical protein [Bacteroidales bacterium]